jgi:hypothetical protein
MMAVAQGQSGHVIGFANPKLYAAYTSAGSSAYHDVTEPTEVLQDRGVVRSDYVNGQDGTNGYSYTVRLFGFDDGLTIKARNGYDDTTGVGTPKGQAFLTAVGG